METWPLNCMPVGMQAVTGFGSFVMKKTFAANWISAARAMAPASSSHPHAFHTLRPGIMAAARPAYDLAQASRG